MPIELDFGRYSDLRRRKAVAEAHLKKLSEAEKAILEETVPLEQDDEFDFITVKTLVGAIIVLKIAKLPGGLKVIETLGKEFIKGIFDTMHALGQASAANKVTAWANPYLVSIILERFGFAAKDKMMEFRVGLSVISGAVVAEGFLDTLQGIFPFGKPEPSEFPTNIVYSARTEGSELVKEEITGRGMTSKEFEQLRSLLRKQ